MKKNVWYLEIEEPVRKIVYNLRNNGINTTCSCGHEMYIEFQTSDPTTDLRNIYNALYESDIHSYKVEIIDKVDDGHHRYGIFSGQITFN